MPHLDEQPHESTDATEPEKRTQESDRRVGERRLFPRPEGRRHDGGRRDEDGSDA